MSPIILLDALGRDQLVADELCAGMGEWERYLENLVNGDLDTCALLLSLTRLASCDAVCVRATCPTSLSTCPLGITGD